MTLLSKLSKQASPGVRVHIYSMLQQAIQATFVSPQTDLDSHPPLEQRRSVAVVLLRCAFVVAEDADSQHLVAYIPCMLPICTTILTSCPRNDIHFLRYLRRPSLPRINKPKTTKVIPTNQIKLHFI